MVGFILYLLTTVLVLYLVLALGVNLIGRLAPVNRKPLLNAVLLGILVAAFLCVAVIRFRTVIVSPIPNGDLEKAS